MNCIRWVALLLMVLVFHAMIKGGIGQSGEHPQSQWETAPVAKTRGNAAGDTSPLAEIGEDVITISQFKKYIRTLPQTQRLMLMRDEKSRRKFLDRLVDTRLAYREALRKGWDKDPEVIEEMEIAKEKIVVSKYFEKEMKAKVTVTREAMEAFYNANRDRFVGSEMIRIRHVLVSTEREAQEILGRLKKGEDFATLAQEKSIDPSGRKGGDLGWVEKRVMDPDLARAAFAMKVGDLSGVVRSKYGYHIIQVEDKRAPVYKELNQVEDLVRKMVSLQEENRLAEVIRERLRKDVKIIIDEELLKGIKIDILNSRGQLSSGDAEKGGH